MLRGEDLEARTPEEGWGRHKARGRDSETKEEICKQEQKGQIGTTRR